MSKTKEAQLGMFSDEDIAAMPVEQQALVEVNHQSSHPRHSAIVASEKITASNLATKLSDAKAMIEFFKQAKTLVLTATKKQDWILIGGDKPYLIESGVKIAHQTIGSKIINMKIEVDERIEDIEGGNFKVIYFTCNAEVLFQGLNFPVIGTSSTKDQFFAARSRELKDEDGKVIMSEDGKYPMKEKYLLPLVQVELQNVKKKCVTNMYKRALDLVFKLNPTKEDLEAINIKLEASGGYGHKTGSGGGSTATPEEKEKRLTIVKLILRLHELTGMEGGAILAEHTKFNDFKGYTDPDRVSPKMLDKTITKLQKLEKDHVAKNGEPKDKK